MRTIVPGRLLAAAVLALAVVLPCVSAAGDPPARDGLAWLEAVRYVATGGFKDEAKPLQAGALVEALSRLPDLAARDPALHEAVLRSLKTRLPDGEEALRRFFEGYPSDSCRARHARTNLDLTDLRGFHAATVVADGRLRAACGLLEKGDAGKAVEPLDEALAMDPRFADAYLHRAIAREVLGDQAAASGDFLEARKTPLGTPSWPAASCLCAPGLAGRLRSLEDRLALARKAKDKGVALFLAGKRQKALKMFDRAVAQDPGDPESYRSRAAAREAAGDLKAAIEDYKKAAQFSPRRADVRAEILASLSSARERTGDLAGAAADLEEALRIAPAPWQERGLALQRLETLRLELADRKARSEASLPPPPQAPESPRSPQASKDVEPPAPPAAAAKEPPAAPPVQSLGPFGQAGAAPGAPQAAGKPGAPSPGGEASVLEVPRSVIKAQGMLRDGKVREAIALLEGLRGASTRHPDYEFLRYEVLSLLAIANLRSGERSVCETMGHDPACLFPRNLQDLRADPKGAREAVRFLEMILNWKPSDLQSRWMMNLAHIRLGEHPGSVPKRWLIPPESFRGADFRRFTDAAPRLGLDVQAHAGGSIMEDFDGDGFLDLMSSSNKIDEPVRYFRNKGDGSFEDLTAGSGLKRITAVMMMAQADYDNDGRPDVLARSQNEEEGRRKDNPGLFLLRNRGDGTFEDVTRKAGLAGARPGWVVAWADFDNDGWLDFFMGNDDLGEAAPALWRGNGDGTFTDVTKTAGISVPAQDRPLAWAEGPYAFVWGANWGDYDNDGRMDLFIAVHGAPKRLYRNLGRGKDGRWRFEEVAARAGINGPLDAFTPWFWDYDNDGFEDLLVFDFPQRSASELAAADSLGLDYNASHPVLYRNLGDGTFEDVSQRAGLTRSVPAMGANFGDLDNDGWLDFYAGTGDPDVRDFVPNLAFRNVGGLRFEDVTTAAGMGLLQKGHGISFGDVDNDGDQDVHAEMGGHWPSDLGRNALFINPGFGNRWVTLRLEGTRSNRSAIGARVKVRASTPQGPREVHRTVTTGGSFGANPLELVVGLGGATAIESIEIRWPATGEKQRLENPPLGSILKVKEGTPGFKVMPRRAVPIKTGG